MLNKPFIKLDKLCHSRTSFDNPEVIHTTFLQARAAKEQDVGISLTYVLPSEKITGDDKLAIRAFYTLQPHTLIPTKELALEGPQNGVAVLCISHLAVCTSDATMSLEVCLAHALRQCANINRFMPIHAVLLNCYDKKQLPFFTALGFLSLQQDTEKTQLFIPFKLINTLFED